MLKNNSSTNKKYTKYFLVLVILIITYLGFVRLAYSYDNPYTREVPKVSANVQEILKKLQSGLVEVSDGWCYKDWNFRAFKGFPGCNNPKYPNYRVARCFADCQPGYSRGAGPDCWKQCATGTTDLGVACSLDLSCPSAYFSGGIRPLCAKKVNLVSTELISIEKTGCLVNAPEVCLPLVGCIGGECLVPELSVTCPSDKPKMIGPVCYGDCPGYMDTVALLCFSNCPSGYTDTGLTCSSMPSCTDDYYSNPQINNGIPEKNYFSDISLSPICKKKTYFDVESESTTCGDNQTNWGVQCLENCKTGYATVANTCFQDCSENGFLTTGCTNKCAINTGACVATIVNQVVSPLLVVVNVVAEVLTAGAATPEIESARVALGSAARTAARAATESVIKNIVSQFIKFGSVPFRLMGKVGKGIKNLGSKISKNALGESTFFRRIIKGFGGIIVDHGTNAAANLQKHTAKSLAKQMAIDIAIGTTGNLVGAGLNVGCQFAAKGITGDKSNPKADIVCTGATAIAGGLTSVGLGSLSGLKGFTQVNQAQVMGAGGLYQSFSIFNTVKTGVVSVLKLGYSFYDFNECIEQEKLSGEVDNKKSCEAMLILYKMKQNDLDSSAEKLEESVEFIRLKEEIKSQRDSMTEEFKDLGYSNPCINEDGLLCRTVTLINLSQYKDEIIKYLAKELPNNTKTNFDVTPGNVDFMINHGATYTEAIACLDYKEEPKNDEEKGCNLLYKLNLFRDKFSKIDYLFSIVQKTNHPKTAGVKPYNVSNDPQYELTPVEKALCYSGQFSVNRYSPVMNDSVCGAIFSAVNSVKPEDVQGKNFDEVANYIASLIDAKEIVYNDKISDTNWELKIQVEDAIITTAEAILEMDRFATIREGLIKTLEGREVGMAHEMAIKHTDAVINAIAMKVAKELANQEVKGFWEDPWFWASIIDPTGVVAVIDAYKSDTCTTLTGLGFDKAYIAGELPTEEDISNYNRYIEGIKRLILAAENGVLIDDEVSKNPDATWINQVEPEDLKELHSKIYVDGNNFNEYYYKFENGEPVLYIFVFDEQKEMRYDQAKQAGIIRYLTTDPDTENEPNKCGIYELLDKSTGNIKTIDYSLVYIYSLLKLKTNSELISIADGEVYLDLSGQYQDCHTRDTIMKLADKLAIRDVPSTAYPDNNDPTENGTTPSSGIFYYHPIVCPYGCFNPI